MMVKSFSNQLTSLKNLLQEMVQAACKKNIIYGMEIKRGTSTNWIFYGTWKNLETGATTPQKVIAISEDFNKDQLNTGCLACQVTIAYYLEAIGEQLVKMWANTTLPTVNSINITYNPIVNKCFINLTVKDSVVLSL